MERKSLLTNRKFMAKLIPSKTVRQSIGGWKPTDFELAVFIRHMKATLGTKCCYFEYILENSDDERLINQIHEFFRFSGGIVCAFQQLEPGHVYVLREPQRKIIECFNSYEEAMAFGLSLKQDFHLMKCPLETIKQERPSFAIDCDFVQYGPDNRNPNLRPGIWYDKDGDVMDWYQPLDCYPGLTVEEAVARQVDLANFENAYVEVPNPFERGDIVTTVTPSWEYGIVVTSQEEWNVYNERLKGGLYNGFSDIAITVAFIDICSDELRFRDIFPFELERSTPVPDKWGYIDYTCPKKSMLHGKDYKELLLAAQSWIQGKSSWEDFCAVRERELRERKVFPWEESPRLEHMSDKYGRYMAEIDTKLQKTLEELQNGKLELRPIEELSARNRKLLAADAIRPMERSEIDAILRKSEEKIRSGKRDIHKEGMSVEEYRRRRKEAWGHIKNYGSSRLIECEEETDG